VIDMGDDSDISNVLFHKRLQRYAFSGEKHKKDIKITSKHKKLSTFNAQLSTFPYLCARKSRNTGAFEGGCTTIDDDGSPPEGCNYKLHSSNNYVLRFR
jgi:hypothetical protein